MDEEAELRNPFPSPPSHYTNYTSHNLKLLAVLRQRTSDTGLSTQNEHNILSDQTDLPPWPLSQLEKPRVDWIIEDGCYSVFGDTWFVRPVFCTNLCRTEAITYVDQRNHPIASRFGWKSALSSRSKCRCVFQLQNMADLLHQSQTADRLSCPFFGLYFSRIPH